jgi:hypothetical protein
MFNNPYLDIHWRLVQFFRDMHAEKFWRRTVSKVQILTASKECCGLLQMIFRRWKLSGT